MPPDRGRASKACAACRKGKTRCYTNESTNAACLRCETLGHPCSLAASSNIVRDRGYDQRLRPVGESRTDARLSQLEKTVKRLLERLDDVPVVESTRSDTAASPSPSRPLPRSTSHSVHQSNDTSSAPVNVIRDLAAEIGAQSPDTSRTIIQGIHTDDVINGGLLSFQDATLLLSIFQEHYGRWVAFDTSMSSDTLLATIRKSSLLLCACTLIAVRHVTQDQAAFLAPPLFERAKAQLSTAILTSPQPIEFFQAALILCMWSTTVGQVPLSIDSWLLSGFALQHCSSSGLFDSIANKGETATHSRRDINLRCIWNHLCLVHLHYCVGTRRKAMIGRNEINKCYDILQSDHSTNFETRMVAEINLYWIIYESCCGSSVDLPKTQAALHSWKQDWNVVLDQPRSQFLEMGFHFAQLLAYERSLKSRSARVRDSLLSEMVRLSAAIIRLAMDTTDDRTRHLSDHIYHMITFAAVTLCRLLNLYETQLALSHNIPELDTLVLTLVTWLHSIGLPCHAAHTLGNTVSAFHAKLRPQARPASPPPLDPAIDWMEDIPHFFPGLLDTVPVEGDHWNFLPDWEPFYNGPLT